MTWTIKSGGRILVAACDLSPLTSVSFRQADADDLFVVASEHALHRECRVRPDRHAALDRLSGLDQLGSAEFLVARRRQLGDDQFSLLVVQEEPILVRYQESVPPAPLAGRVQRFPQPAAVARVQTP